MVKPLGFALLLSTLLTACASFTKAREQNISMANKAHTAAELIEVLGEPQSRATSGDLEVWYYDIYSADSKRIYPYTAKVQGGNLLEFYADGSPRNYSRVELLRVRAAERRPSQVED